MGTMAAMAWDGEDYQARFDHLAASGLDVHGEADFVEALGPASVLDAGCGTGRVAVELARRGIEVVGVDVDGSMLETARRLGSRIEFIESDLAALDLERAFDVVLMAGNVLLFTKSSTERLVVAGCARHVASAGALVAGFQLDRAYGLDAYDADAAAAGLELTERYSTWDRAPFEAGASASAGYAVSVHRRGTPE
jgi:2-polyprenyl-3-methyl-5-hydroxy-6-metoxy-1,4-benzoquinol methylase